jgi:hypothetical protein
MKKIELDVRQTRLLFFMISLFIVGNRLNSFKK